MNYLKDSCIFINKIPTHDKIYEVIQLVKKCEDSHDLSVSTEILDELKKGSLGNIVYNFVQLEMIKKIDLNDSETMQDEYNKIRNKYYGWIRKNDYLNHLIEKGVLDIELVKSKKLLSKGVGECSLLAIAVAEPKKHTIVTEDKGRVEFHPHINIFDYAPTNVCEIIDYAEFLRRVK